MNYTEDNRAGIYFRCGKIVWTPKDSRKEVAIKVKGSQEPY
jgi:hypothetical protein